ncbi:MAG: response regulator [Hymenobacter sp.]|nr:MAG: response regulator [Hymenobacter sp.]
MQKFSDGPIIYVNDDDDDHFLFREIVTGLGYATMIRPFWDGEDALKYLRDTSEKPLLVLCDISMPRMSGLELRKQIDQSEYLRQKAIPFVFFTTEASPVVVKQAYEGTIQGFHTKEVLIEEYKQQIQLIVTYWQTCRHPGNLTW